MLIVLVLVAAVLGAMGTGIMGEPWNEIKLVAQKIGWGEKDIESPITTASIELRLESETQDDNQQDPVTIVTACAFHSDEEIAAGLGRSDGKLICKLLNEQLKPIAEGDIPITSYMASDTIVIDINQPIFIGANQIENVFDAMVIVEGPL